MSGDRTTRREVVDELRGHADSLDAGELTAREAANETRRLARQLERESPRSRARADGGAVGRAKEFGAAGVELTEKAMGNLLTVLTAILWMAAGSAGVGMDGLACLLGGVVTLAVANRLKGWSS